MNRVQVHVTLVYNYKYNYAFIIMRLDQSWYTYLVLLVQLYMMGIWFEISLYPCNAYSPTVWKFWKVKMFLHVLETFKKKSAGHGFIPYIPDVLKIGSFFLPCLPILDGYLLTNNRFYVILVGGIGGKFKCISDEFVCSLCPIYLCLSTET